MQPHTDLTARKNSATYDLSVEDAGLSHQESSVTAMRPSTLSGLGLGTVLDIFKNGQLPVTPAQMIDRVFGEKQARRAMVISGANGIVGAGKVMQFGARLLPYEVPVIALDLPGAADGLQQQFKGLTTSFGPEMANDIMKSILRMHYDGKHLPPSLQHYRPAFLLEAIPEQLHLKKAHYEMMRDAFPDIHIWSVTSGFPSAQLGVDIAHPSFPHEINKVFEIVEAAPSAQTHLLWSLGLIPVKVSDHWSFVLDVFFCGLLQASLQFCRLTNTPYWKADKYIRQSVGPNPFRAHDVIGAKGSNFLTWSCLHHLGQHYGPLFEPESALTEHKESGQAWYPPPHFRPLINWHLEAHGQEALQHILYGALFQMTSIMLREKRSDLTSMNAIGELCAQFSRGLLAVARQKGKDEIISHIEAYHKLVPKASSTTWYPEAFDHLDHPAWSQLYVNAERHGHIGVITISREAYNHDVDRELNRAIDWLRHHHATRVIVTGDFHLSTQMVGADTSEFYPALRDVEVGERLALEWSKTARRLYTDFEISLGCITGKRCMGGMLELMMHCHYLFAVDHAGLAMPEVTLPVLPGMEGCHWPLRKVTGDHRERVVRFLLEGKTVKAKEATAWLVDYADTLEHTLRKAWQVMVEGRMVMENRLCDEGPLDPIAWSDLNLQSASSPSEELARQAMVAAIQESCRVNLNDALWVQARHSAAFMLTPLCHKGKVGNEFDKIMNA